MTEKIAITPGIYEDISFEDYCRWDAINQSKLKEGRRSPAHLKHALEDCEVRDSAALLFGRLCHAGKLEPLTIAQQYIVMPRFEDDLEKEYKNPKASKEYKEKVDEFERVNVGKEVVTQDDYEHMMGICRSLCAVGYRSAEYLNSDGKAEVSICWEDETGLLCKARIDKWSPDQRRIVDLKTTADAANFKKSIANFGYDFQAAFYVDGMTALTGVTHEFCIVAVEKTPPYGVRSAPLHPDAIANGRRNVRRVLDELVESRASGHWPGYSDPDYWELPAWAMCDRPVQLVVQGEYVEL